MAFKAGGNCLRKFLQIMMLIYATGSCIGYQIFIGELVNYILKETIGDSDFLESFEFRLCVNGPIAAIILLPLSLKKDMSDLAIMGIVSVGALLYTLLVLVIEMPFYWKEYRHAKQTVMHAFKFDMNILTSFSLVFFAYTCQMAILPVYSELVNPNYRRISKVINRALAVDVTFYLIIASAGYFSMFNATSDVVI